MSSLRDRVKILEEEVVVYVSKLELAKLTISRLEERLERLFTESSDRNEEIKKLKGENNMLQKWIDDFTEATVHWNAKIEELELDKKELARIVSDSERTISEYKAEVRKFREELERRDELERGEWSPSRRKGYEYRPEWELSPLESKDDRIFAFGSARITLDDKTFPITSGTLTVYGDTTG